MARAKHPKRKKQTKRRPATFHESLAALQPQPVLKVEVPPMVQSGLDTATNYSRVTGQWALRTWTAAAVACQAFYQQQLVPAWRRTESFLASVWVAAGPYGRTAGLSVDRSLRWTGRHIWSRRARALYVALLASLAMVGVFTSVATMALYTHDISSPAALLNKKKTGTTILDRNGQVLFQGYGAQNTTVVPLGQMPATLKDATLAAEDPDFYSHPGFSWRATVRAAWVDVTHHGKVEGGSTLTQQLVKNAILTSNKTFERKFQELLLSMELEQRYSKDQILEMYLNETFYGQGSNGVEAAAQTYFHKSAKDLSLSESALVAGLPLGPSRFDPNANPQAATDRRNYVLDRMADLGKISHQQADAAKAEPVVAYPRTITIRAPHFVFYVLDTLRQQYGEDMIENGGLTVQTTLDLGKQEAAQTIVQQQITRLSEHHATNGGLISLEPSTGDIISMVGSVDYNAPGFGAVNVTMSQLQPGSSFKPIAYVTAFEKGWNGATQVDDKPLQLPQGDGTMYVPQNYDGKFRGKVTLRRALANSLNIPAIEVLQYAGLDATIDTAHALGITSLNDRSRYGASLVLGGGEVRMIDMATVYGTFANGGSKVEPRSILKVSDRYGKEITKPTAKPAQKVLDPRYAYMITNILSDNQARTEEFGANSPLKLSRPAAAKTGTTNDFRDNWTVGYTPNLVTAVWVGNNDHSAMSNVDGITGAAPIWHDYMEMAHAGVAVQPFVAPAGVMAAKVCSADGGLANAWDSGYDEIFLTDQPQTRHCSTMNGDSMRRLWEQFKNQTQPTPATPDVPVTPEPPITPQPVETPPIHGKPIPF
jgi:1A family penicillin-binding protein